MLIHYASLSLVIAESTKQMKDFVVGFYLFNVWFIYADSIGTSEGPGSCRFPGDPISWNPSAIV